MGLLAWLFGCGQRNDPPSTQPSANPYHKLRDMALTLTPEKLNVNATANQPIAILMESGWPEGVVTLAAVADGTASLYFDNGGGIIGAGEHREVSKVSISFVRTSAEYIKHMSKTTDFPLPPKGKVRFYVVTSGGVFTAEGVEDDLGNMRSPYSPLFHKGHELITAMREHSEKE